MASGQRGANGQPTAAGPPVLAAVVRAATLEDVFVLLTGEEAE